MVPSTDGVPRVEPGELDAERLERALLEGDRESLAAALALWRGAPLAQVAYHDFARTEVDRLHELRQAAIEARLEAELENGEHARLLPELEALVRAHPLREAWFVYNRSRYGVYVGYSGAGAGAAFIDARFNDVRQDVRLNRLFDHSASFALTADAAWVATAGYVVRIDRSTGRVLRTVRVSPVGAGGFEYESGIAVGGEAVWAIGSADVVRIDPSTGDIVARIPIAQNVTRGAPNPTAIAVGEDAVWVASRRVEFSALTGAPAGGSPVLRGFVSRIDPTTNAVAATIQVGADPFAVAVGEDSVWVANRRGFTIGRVDPRTNRVVASIPVGSRPQGIAAGGGAVWVSVS